MRELASVSIDRGCFSAGGDNNSKTSEHSNVLSWSGEFETGQLEAAAVKLATERSEDLTKADGFMRMGRLHADGGADAVAGWRTAEKGQA